MNMRARQFLLSFLSLTLAPLMASSAFAQQRPDVVDGHVSIGADYLPNVGDTLEMRARLFVERQVDAGPNLRFSFSGWAEGLIADRADSFRPELSIGSRTVRDAVARPHEAYVDLRAGSFDVRAGRRPARG